MANFKLITRTQHYIGASTDTKPSSPAVGSLAWETETRWRYIWDGTTWHKKSSEERY